MGRRKWTVEQKLEIVLAGLALGANVFCCMSGVTSRSNREQELEKELQEAKTLLGEQAMQIEILRKKTNWNVASLFGETGVIKKNTISR